MITITQLYFYPVKSCAAIKLTSAEIGSRGIKNDRDWMVVDKANRFVSQRECRQMALIKPHLLDDNLLTLAAPEMPDIKVPSIANGLKLEVTVWDDTCTAIDQGDEVAHWLSEFLKSPCRLVRMHPDFTRKVDARYAQRLNDEVGFADGYPLLLISEASLEDLNTRLSQPVPMSRFRPNIVVTGCQPYAEDDWKTIAIGEIDFDFVKPCARCVITCTDQLNAQVGTEPLKTLSGYRRKDNKVLFGQNVIHRQPGTISVGDSVVLISQVNDATSC